MKDLIERQAAIEAIEKHIRTAEEPYQLTDADKVMNHAFEIAASCVYNLSATEADVPDINDGDMISRQAAIDAINGVLVEDESCKVWFRLAVKNLPSAQPDEEKISDALYNIYRNKGTSTSAEGVAAIKYYIAEIWREIFGEEGPIWLKK